jgi:isochorismate synthase
VHEVEAERRRVERATVDAPIDDAPRRREAAVLAAGAHDPWEFLELAAREPIWFAWHDGARAATLIGWGAAAVCQARGADRFRALQAWYSEQREQRFVDPALPVALGGLAFEAEPPGGVFWAGWPAAELFVPRVLSYRSENTGFIVVRDRHAERTAHALAGAVRDVRPRRSDAVVEPNWATVPDRRSWEASVHATVNDIAACRLEKLVMARAAVHQGRVDALGTLRALRERHPRAMTFAYGRGRSVFVGASPETLAAVRGSALDTAAVAGTSPAGHGAGLLASEKDRHEHALVIDDVRAALAPICDRVDVAGRPELHEAGSVVHLATPIHATLAPRTTLLAAAELLHPTAALCGVPRPVARRLLAERETLDRGWYGGPIGWLDGRGGGVLAVAIRSALLEPGRALAFAGAGIVRGSSPAAEWEETERKLETVAGALRAEVEP